MSEALTAVFWTADGVVALLIARVVQGIATSWYVAATASSCHHSSTAGTTAEAERPPAARGAAARR